MAKRRKRKRGKAGWLMIVAIALIIAGFMARRLMMPPAVRYLAHHSEDYPAAPPQADNDHAPAAHSNDNGTSEHLTDSDRRALDEVIRRKTESH
jgi:hypothetical protein